MNIMDEESWYKVHQICHEKPGEIVKLIIGTKNVKKHLISKSKQYKIFISD